MIVAKRAPVRPRVHSASGESLLLEEEVRVLLQAGATGIVAVLGPAGSGKTTALAHLAAVLPPDCKIQLVDSPDNEQLQSLHGPGNEQLRQAARSYLVIYVAASVRVLTHRATYRLASWTRDELIEYLLALHRDRCGSVIARVHREDDTLLKGSPELWHMVLEELACDDLISGASAALAHALEAYLRSSDLRDRVQTMCLNLLVPLIPVSNELAGHLTEQELDPNLLRLLRHRAIQLLLATERVANSLSSEASSGCLSVHLPYDLIQSVAKAIRGKPGLRDHLHRLLAGPPWNHSMAASLLHAVEPSWVPEPGALTALAGAYLAGVCWKQVQLAHSNLREADLSSADLAGADLAGANAEIAMFRHTNLHGASLPGFQATEADLFRANLSAARAPNASFDDACLEGANLDEAILRHASFIRTVLAEATLRGADLRQADLSGAVLEDADFSGANLREANLTGLVLRAAQFRGADFAAAVLTGCDLEGMELPDANFAFAQMEHALLTGSVMPRADFSGAKLAAAGLADIDWEAASLRQADLHGASFHLGSSRSGLVDSPIASEGSRTGFYTDDYEEQHYKAPEEIRKANLRDADLRGANIEDVDFYLVDLRGAQLDPEQEEHVRRCGAILEARV